jgi:ParB-like chromosome segregation protein Spo0J
MSKGEYKLLYQDIASNGIREPICYVIDNGVKKVVDGHHRLKIARALGIASVPTREVSLPYKGFYRAADLRGYFG